MSQGQDPFEMIKNFWANVPGMGNGGMGGMGAMGGAAMPSFDPEDLAKRLGELKQVKQWLEMNLNMLNLQINTMEMQLSAINSFKGDGYGSAGARHAPPHKHYEHPSSAPPDMRQANEAASEAAKAASAAGAQAIEQGTQAFQALPWANPGEWLKSMQAAFTPPASPAKKKSNASARSAPKKQPAARPAASAAKRATPRKRSKP